MPRAKTLKAIHSDGWHPTRPLVNADRKIEFLCFRPENIVIRIA